VKSNEATIACPEWILYQQEQSRAALGTAQGVVWRRDPLRVPEGDGRAGKTANSFLGALNLAAVLDWLKR
jgi:hypothetical protein